MSILYRTAVFIASIFVAGCTVPLEVTPDVSLETSLSNIKPTLILVTSISDERSIYYPPHNQAVGWIASGSHNAQPRQIPRILGQVMKKESLRLRTLSIATNPGDVEAFFDKHSQGVVVTLEIGVLEARSGWQARSLDFVVSAHSELLYVLRDVHGNVLHESTATARPSYSKSSGGISIGEQVELMSKAVHSSVLMLLSDSGMVNSLMKEEPVSSDAIGSIQFGENLPKGNTRKTASSGSGFLLTRTGLVVTNHHVVLDASDIHVVFPSVDKSFEATIALKDAINDIALLKLKDFYYESVFNSDIPYRIVPSSSAHLGQEVFTLGFPLSGILGSQVNFSSGKINSVFGIDDDPRLLQISNPIQPGSSGSPLFNTKGELVGIIVSTIGAEYILKATGTLPQNVNFSIKSDYLLNLISLLPEAS
jgi:S1-C subfamily serine protease